ncbi:MAG: hypothetical protein IJE10_08725 [Clostridia bacterium]|nr:hypothetical protein [Clostridia bacterium]
MLLKAIHAKEIAKTLSALLFLAVFLLFPDPCTRAAKDGLNMAMYLVLPSLFPFSVIAGYLSGRIYVPQFFCRAFRHLTGLPENACSLFVLGVLSGFPVGAVLIGDAVKNNAITKSIASHLLPLSTLCGPIFMIGVVGGGMLGSYKLGYILYGIQLLSLVLVSLLFKGHAPYAPNSAQLVLPKKNLVDAIEKSVSNLIAVCGFIVFFQVVCQMLLVTGLAENLCPYPPFLYGLTELSCGCNRIVLSDIPLHIKAGLLSFFCSFSGFCVMLQVAHAVRDCGLSLSKYVLYKLCMGVVSFLLSVLVLRYFPIETFGLPVKSDSFSFSDSFLVLCYIAFALSTLFLFILRKFMGHTFDNR